MTDYGCADASAAEFETLKAYSPLHNVRTDGKYPAFLLLTGDHDDRVVPLHTLKLVATLQAAAKAAGGGPAPPIVARVDVKSGHGAGKPTSKVIDEVSDVYGFVARALGATWHA